MGGLVGGLLDVVGSTLHTVTGVIGTVGTIGQTVLPPPVPGNSDVPPPLVPIDGVLGPVLSDGSVSGGGTATVPTLIGTAVAPAATAPETEAPAATVTTVSSTHSSLTDQPGHADATRTQQQQPPRQQQQQHDSDTHVGTGGGSSGGGLPAAPSAPMAPTSTATPGHDSSGGARQMFAVTGDSVTTTQLKLIGVSRDHEVDGAGREAALPTTSPD